MLPHVPQDVEARHRLHLDVRDHYLRLNTIQLLDRFRRRIKRKNFVPFFATKRHDDLYHCRLIVDDYDFGHSQRGEYVNFEKMKEAGREF